MKSGTLAGRLWHDRGGATFLEFTIVFPLLMLTAFCTVDFALIMFDWAMANKAVQNGTRMAVVAAPVAAGLNDLTYNVAELGNDCSDPDGADAGICSTIETVCTPSEADDPDADDDGSCTEEDHPFSDAAYDPIFAEMNRVFPRLERQNVRITYRTTGLGFVGRPGGLPMEVTLELRCLTHQMFFLGALAGWAFEPRDGCDDETGVPVPSFATTLTTEALGS